MKISKKHHVRRKGRGKGKVRKNPKKRMTYSEIQHAGNKISKGYGFWGHEIHEDPEVSRMAVRAWVNGLRARGYADKDIIFYGDWRDGRHIADSMYDSDYRTMLAMVKRSASSASEVRRKNIEAYAEDYKRIQKMRKRRRR